jgi:hypothetical protein
MHTYIHSAGMYTRKHMRNALSIWFDTTSLLSNVSHNVHDFSPDLCNALLCILVIFPVLAFL